MPLRHPGRAAASLGGSAAARLRQPGEGPGSGEHVVEHLLGEPADRTGDLIANHRRIVDALRAHDADAARDAMRLHFRDVRDRITRAEAEAEAEAAATASGDEAPEAS